MKKYLKDLIDKLDKNEFAEFYNTHSYSEIFSKYEINKHYLLEILKYFNIETGSAERQSYLSKRSHENNKYELGSWYNNGFSEIFLKEKDIIPEGFIKGRLKRVCYTDGINSIKLLENETPPEGFYRGRLQRKLSDEEEFDRRFKISSTIKDFSQEKRDEITTSTKQTKLEIYGDPNYNNWKKRKETCKKIYDNENYSNRELFKETCNNKSQEEKDEINKKRSDSLIEFYENISEEDMERIRNSHLGHITSEETKEKLRNAWTPDKIEQMLEKYTSTCNERYGVPYFCMSDQSKSSYRKFSKANQAFYKLLEEANIKNIQIEFPIANRSYDFKVNNNLIEINPTATHNSTWSPFGENSIKKNNYHYEKSKLARENGFRCIHIFDWDDPVKVINLLLPRETVYARKCTIKEVDLSTTREYLNTNHLQGYAKDSIRLGLYYNDELVSIMTFDKPRYNKNYEYELVRYCSSYKVLGGAEKLFKYFINNYNPKSIISYCDYSKFNGDTYLKLGFKFKNVSISKHWYNVETRKHITDNLLRQRGFDQLFGTNYGKGTSNEQLMIENGFVEVYDAGQAVYTLERT